MLPIDALMQEHRLIERMIFQMQKELALMGETNTVDTKFITAVVDFIWTYADRCHHGKEEGVLFKELAAKQISSEHAEMVRDLIDEHVYVRKTTANLAKTNESYIAGNNNVTKEIFGLMQALFEFYPMHAQKEDKKFFGPSMEYFTLQEQETMLDEFGKFDRKIIHEHYAKIVGELEKQLNV